MSIKTFRGPELIWQQTIHYRMITPSPQNIIHFRSSIQWLWGWDPVEVIFYYCKIHWCQHWHFWQLCIKCELECVPVGCVTSAAVAVSGSGGSAQGGVCIGRGVCLWVYAWGLSAKRCVLYTPTDPEADTPAPWTEWQTLVKTLPFPNYCCRR